MCWKLNIENNIIVKEVLKSQLVYKFKFEHSQPIYNLVLTKDEKILFSGCDGGVLVQHSTKTFKPIGDPLQLNIGMLKSMDLNSNILLVGGHEQFRIIQLKKRVDSGIGTNTLLWKLIPYYND